jgi:hypothetical protein
MFRKYMKTEHSEVANPEDHRRISKALRRLGKRSMRDLTEEERKNLDKSLDTPS